MDTDSAYSSLSNDSFQSLVSPSTLSHYNCINTSCSNALYVPSLTNPDRCPGNNGLPLRFRSSDNFRKFSRSAESRQNS